MPSNYQRELTDSSKTYEQYLAERRAIGDAIYEEYRRKKAACIKVRVADVGLQYGLTPSGSRSAYRLARLRLDVQA